MPYSKEQKWSLFTGLLHNNANPELREVWRRIQHDLHMELVAESAVVARLEAGHYGADASKMWQAFLDTD